MERLFSLLSQYSLHPSMHSSKPLPETLCKMVKRKRKSDPAREHKFARQKEAKQRWRQSSDE
jgi:hypothetical protein